MKELDKYIEKYGYDFALHACKLLEYRKLYIQSERNRDNTERIKNTAKKLGVRLKGERNE